MGHVIERARALETLDLGQRLLCELGQPTGRRNAPVSIHYYFALLYHGSVVRNIELAQRSRASPLLYALIPAFHELYVDSVIRRVRGEQAYRSTPLWDRYFRLAGVLDRDRLWLGLPLLLHAGARAHIVGDLPEAIASVFATTDDSDLVAVAAADLFGADSSLLYATVMEDFARALGEAPHLVRRPVATAMFRLSDRLLRAPIVGGLQIWRRGALAKARAALAMAPAKLPAALVA